MYGFILKKNFCDTWDNLFSVAIVNSIFVLAMTGIVLLSYGVSHLLGDKVPEMIFYLAQLLVLILGLFIASTIALSYGELAVKIADFKSVTLLDFFKEIPGVLKDAIFLALFITAVAFVSGYSITYYVIDNQSKLGLFLGALIFWIDVFIILSLIWFVPIRSTFHNNFKKCLKKCFIIFMDNTGYTILVALNNLVMLILSVVLIGLIPSLAGILISTQNAFRIRLYKYDYLEEHPELQTRKERRQIPWEELIYEDRETLGPRTLKSFLFPWKE